MLHVPNIHSQPLEARESCVPNKPSSTIDSDELKYCKEALTFIRNASAYLTTGPSAPCCYNFALTRTACRSQYQSFCTFSFTCSLYSIVRYRMVFSLFEKEDCHIKLDSSTGLNTKYLSWFIMHACHRHAVSSRDSDSVALEAQSKVLVSS
jgi:hypothetical protein